MREGSNTSSRESRLGLKTKRDSILPVKVQYGPQEGRPLPTRKRGALLSSAPDKQTEPDYYWQGPMAGQSEPLEKVRSEAGRCGPLLSQKFR